MKTFFEILPDLKLSQDLAELFESACVDKVAASPDRSRIKIYMISPRLIGYGKVRMAEKEISGQMFGGKVSVSISERFVLSGQYTLEHILAAYSDSIIEELSETGIVMRNLFEKSEKLISDDDALTISVVENEITKVKASLLADYLVRLFEQRFGMQIACHIEWLEEKKEDKSLRPDGSVDEEVQRIVQAYEEASERRREEEQAAPAKKKEAADFRNKKKYVKEKLPEDKSLFFGKNFDGEETLISAIVGEMGDVIVRGMITEMEIKEIKNEKSIVVFAITDFTDTIKGKVFIKNEKLPELLSGLKKDAFVKLKAVASYDAFDKDIALGYITGIKAISDFREKRMDHAPEKRVELHCHTTMSDSDGVSAVKDLLKNAMSWGHTAMAITDHGVVQAFTDANHVVEKTDFKPIYGCEGYLVDDINDIVVNSRGQSILGDYVVFDIETTGFSAVKDRIIEIGAVKISDGQITDRFSEFVNPKRPIPLEIEKLTGINDSMVMEAGTIETVLPAFLDFCRGCALVAHNARFDTGFIKENMKRQGEVFDFTYVDTLAIARSFMEGMRNYKLDTVASALNVSLENHHRAVDDAECTAHIFLKFIERFKKKSILDLNTLSTYSQMTDEAVKKLRPYHIILLAKNEIGRIHLYQLVSLSHLKYYSRRPLIPRSVLMAHREGLIVGSACEAGELFRAIVDDRSEEDIARIVEFYDYLEIQPTGNNAFMLRSDKYPYQTKEELEELTKRVVRLGEQFDKPVCATCDVHFMNPEDEVYRRIIMSNKGFEDADEQAPLYFRTTREMLSEFDFLGSDKAYEVVVTNTNHIADMIDYIKPVRPDKCPPVIENSDKILREICYNKAHELYGENLPELVVERLERELNSIIGNGFAVMYIIAQKLVWKSVADGYLVGSRGSVGSSFVAYMAGITEVNSLQAHYLCPKCHYVDFDSDYVKSFSGRSGCDMEDRKCPVCGEALTKEGHDIPFETFLGFKGNKEPDIDLNFSGEYQSKAHAYTEVIFGKGKTFRAGTVGTLADKTAYGYAMHYFEDKQIHKRPCEITRVSAGCVGVRRTTGQHPGGIIVVPHGEEIYSFTPVQHPANDQTTRIITTHFDYHSIDHNLLKLDILGHDDPTMIRMLEDLTEVDATTIRLDDPEVLSLFTGLDALGITKDDIGGTDLGSLGIPEFGTNFAMNMLRETHPTAFSDLVRIAGLSHGTDVWTGNAQDLIREGTATISTCICTRDDIMIYLIGKGLESEKSFKIMESVRKGKGLTPDWEKEMRAHDVPEWYIDSCKKIKYMFPKAHAVAYVMMGMRIAWFKVHIPLAYYAAFFTIRATDFDYELMCQGKEKLDGHIRTYKAIPNPSAKEKDTLRDMKIVQEFYARGFEFLPMDLYKSEAAKFQIIGDKLLPPFSSIGGMGTTAAEALYIAAKGEPFLSKDDIKQRAKVSSTVVDMMAELGILGDLPESNQLSLADFGLLQ